MLVLQECESKGRESFRTGGVRAGGALGPGSAREAKELGLCEC